VRLLSVRRVRGVRAGGGSGGEAHGGGAVRTIDAVGCADRTRAGVGRSVLREPSVFALPEVELLDGQSGADPDSRGCLAAADVGVFSVDGVCRGGRMELGADAGEELADGVLGTRHA